MKINYQNLHKLDNIIYPIIILRLILLIMKSTAKANGKNWDGMIYSTTTFQTSYRVHFQAKTTT